MSSYELIKDLNPYLPIQKRCFGGLAGYMLADLRLTFFFYKIEI